VVWRRREGVVMTDGQAGQHDFGAGLGDSVELLVDDGPLRVDDGLILLWVLRGGGVVGVIRIIPVVRV